MRNLTRVVLASGLLITACGLIRNNGSSPAHHGDPASSAGGDAAEVRSVAGSAQIGGTSAEFSGTSERGPLMPLGKDFE